MAVPEGEAHTVPVLMAAAHMAVEHTAAAVLQAVPVARVPVPALHQDTGRAVS